jgi:mannose-6-phosphate isomerase-like protein (cupin superfamily)
VQPRFYDLSSVDKQRIAASKTYLEFLRVPTMSAGLYVIPRGGDDPQEPHQEDEIYYVARGRARMTAGRETRSVGPGSVIFVPAELEHHFHNIEEELEVLVVFAPAETNA